MEWILGSEHFHKSFANIMSMYFTLFLSFSLTLWSIAVVFITSFDWLQMNSVRWQQSPSPPQNVNVRKWLNEWRNYYTLNHFVWATIWWRWDWACRVVSAIRCMPPHRIHRWNSEATSTVFTRSNYFFAFAHNFPNFYNNQIFGMFTLCLFRVSVCVCVCVWECQMHLIAGVWINDATMQSMHHLMLQRLSLSRIVYVNICLLQQKTFRRRFVCTIIALFIHLFINLLLREQPTDTFWSVLEPNSVNICPAEMERRKTLSKLLVTTDEKKNCFQFYFFPLFRQPSAFYWCCCCSFATVDICNWQFHYTILPKQTVTSVKWIFYTQMKNKNKNRKKINFPCHVRDAQDRIKNENMKSNGLNCIFWSMMSS